MKIHILYKIISIIFFTHLQILNGAAAPSQYPVHVSKSVGTGIFGRWISYSTEYETCIFHIEKEFIDHLRYQQKKVFRMYSTPQEKEKLFIFLSTQFHTQEKKKKHDKELSETIKKQEKERLDAMLDMALCTEKF